MEKMMMNTQTKQRGFSLIELLVVIAIVMILAALALPSYDAYIQRSRLENARATVVDNIKMMEQHYAKNRTFQGVTSAIQVGDASKYYEFGIILINNNNDYLITAKPLSNVYTADQLSKKQLYLVYHSGSGSYARCTKDGFDKVATATSTESTGCDAIQ